MRGTSRDALAAGQERLDAVIASAEGEQVTRIADELFAVVHLLEGEPSLRRAVSDPALPAQQKARLIDSLLGAQVSGLALEVLHTLVGARWSRGGDLVDALEELAVQALLTVSEQNGSLDDVEDELFRFGRLVDREPALRAALTDRGMPTDRKTALLDSLLADKARPATLRLVREAVTDPRGRTFDRILDDYGRAAAARRDRLVARVRVAVPLTEEQSRRLAAALSVTYGHAIHLNVEIDPSVVGGISVQVGDEMFDGTVAHRLAEARRHLGG